MSDGYKKVGFARTAVTLLLLALLLNANAHVFAHLNDFALAQTTVSSQDQTESSNTLSPFGNNDCLSCQSLQNLQLGATDSFAQFTTDARAAVNWCVPLFSTFDPARATSNRAPPYI